MASGIYDEFKEDLALGAVNLTSDTIGVTLLDSNHAFSATDASWAAVSANEATGTGYTAGGATLAGSAVSVVGNTMIWDATDVSWAASTFTAAHVILYSITNSSSLIASLDLGGNQSASNGTFTVEWSSAGIITLT